MDTKVYADQRLALQIAEETWAREDADGRRRVVEVAPRAG